MIVVGGGMAGLSAAENLLATSGGRVGKPLLLEAGQRLTMNLTHLLFIDVSPETTREQIISLFSLLCKPEMQNSGFVRTIGFLGGEEGHTPWRWREARWKWGQTGSMEAGQM